MDQFLIEIKLLIFNQNRNRLIFKQNWNTVNRFLIKINWLIFYQNGSGLILDIRNEFDQYSRKIKIDRFLLEIKFARLLNTIKHY